LSARLHREDLGLQAAESEETSRFAGVPTAITETTRDIAGDTPGLSDLEDTLDTSGGPELSIDTERES